MLGKADSPYILSLMKLLDTQSKVTIANFCVSYAEKTMLPLYEKYVPDDCRPRAALNAAKDWLKGTVKLPFVKKLVLEAHAAAREAEEYPAAQAAARAVGQAAAVVHTATHSLGLAFYGAAAIAYDRIGTAAKEEEYEQIAAEVCKEIEKELRDVSVENEPNPAKLKWYC